MVRFQTFEQFHNKKNVGSTKIRVHNLIKYWDDADLYKYGENPEVLIFQKVYMTQDYRMPKYFKGLKILDICDPDWLDGALIKETVDVMDGVVCPTENIAKFIRQLTDKPVKVIKDRFDLDKFTKKEHEGKTTKVVWFGYMHNAEILKFTMPSLENRNLQLIVVSNQDPQAWGWVMEDPEKYKDKYTFYAWREQTAYKQIQEADICVLPKGGRPQDKFKSENKTTIARLLGLPVATNADELDALMTAEARIQEVDKWYDKTRMEFDCKKSVQEYQDFIKELEVQRG